MWTSEAAKEEWEALVRMRDSFGDTLFTGERMERVDDLTEMYFKIYLAGERLHSKYVTTEDEK